MNMIAFNHDAALPLSTTLSIDRHGSRPAALTGDDQSAFASVMSKQSGMNENETNDATAARKAEARQAANQLVSSAFLIPILSKLRETSMAEGPFAPGAAEKRFGPMLDQHLADRIIEASNFDIVDAIAERYGNHGNHDSRIAREQPLGRFERIG